MLNLTTVQVRISRNQTYRGFMKIKWWWDFHRLTVVLKLLRKRIPSRDKKRVSPIPSRKWSLPFLLVPPPLLLPLLPTLPLTTHSNHSARARCSLLCHFFINCGPKWRREREGWSPSRDESSDRGLTRLRYSFRCTELRERMGPGLHELIPVDRKWDHAISVPVQYSAKRWWLGCVNCPPPGRAR